MKGVRDMLDGKKNRREPLAAFARINNWIHCLSMKKKMGFTFTLLFLISMLCIFNIYMKIYSRDITDSQYKLFEQMTISCQTVMDNMIEHVDYIARVPLFSKQMQIDMNEKEALRRDSMERFEQSLSVLGTDEQHKYVILLYNKARKIIYSNFSLENGYMAKNEPDLWYDAAVAANGKTCFLPYQDERNKYSCVAVKLIKDTSTYDELGVMAIAMPRELLLRACEPICNDIKAHVFLKNKSGEVIFASDDSFSPEAIKADDNQMTASGESDILIDKADYLGYATSSVGKKYSIFIYSQKKDIMQRLYQSQMLLYIIWILGAIIVAGATVFFSNEIIRPLKCITELMEDVQQGDMSARFPAKYTDEVGILGKNFNIMLERIDEMTKRLVTAETIQCKAEIDALKGQIQPHFVYNILETFYMMAIENNNNELADLILRFGKLMRYNITLMNEITTIRQEVEYLQNYLYIQNSRYKNRADLICSIPEKMLDTHIIKLLLEPVVENAIIHGFEANTSGTRRIELSGYESDNERVFEITDNGAGMTDERLNELRASLSTNYLETESSKFIGLRNVNERIKLYYGEAYGIEIDSKKNRKTTVTIRIPREENELSRV